MDIFCAKAMAKDLEEINLSDRFWTTTHVRKYVNAELGLEHGNDVMTSRWMRKHNIPRLQGSQKTTRKLVDAGIKAMETKALEDFKNG